MLLQLYDEDGALLISCTLGEQGLRAVNPLLPERLKTPTPGLFDLLSNKCTYRYLTLDENTDFFFRLTLILFLLMLKVA